MISTLLSERVVSSLSIMPSTPDCTAKSTLARSVKEGTSFVDIELSMSVWKNSGTCLILHRSIMYVSTRQT